MSLNDEIERIQSRCACVRLNGNDCMRARSPRYDDLDDSDTDEECSCACHNELHDLLNGEDWW